MKRLIRRIVNWAYGYNLFTDSLILNQAKENLSARQAELEFAWYAHKKDFCRSDKGGKDVQLPCWQKTCNAIQESGKDKDVLKILKRRGVLLYYDHKTSEVFTIPIKEIMDLPRRY